MPIPGAIGGRAATGVIGRSVAWIRSNPLAGSGVGTMVGDLLGSPLALLGGGGGNGGNGGDGGSPLDGIKNFLEQPIGMIAMLGAIMVFMEYQTQDSGGLTVLNTGQGD